MTDFYVYASSSYDRAKYPQNKVGDFIVELPPRLRLNSSWEVKVLAVQVQRKQGPTAHVFLCCNLVTESYVGARSAQALAHLSLGRRTTNFDFRDGQYVRLKDCRGVSQMRLTILDADTLEPVSFLQGALRCTLHFKPQE